MSDLKEAFGKFKEAVKRLDDITNVKEVVFNTDVMNDEENIYFPTERNMFSVWRCPAYGEFLPESIINAYIGLINLYCAQPTQVMIPFMLYCEYAAQKRDDTQMAMTLENVCKAHGLKPIILVPDRLKNKL